MDLEGLSITCAGIGGIQEDENGAPIGYTPSEFCLDNLKDLQRFLRRDDPQTRDVFKQICKWNTVSKDLIPIIEHCQAHRDLVINAVKVLVFLTMPIESTSNDISQQIEYLWELKVSITRSDTIAVIVSLLEEPLENLEREAFTEDNWKLVQLVLTLFRNALAVQDLSLQQKASGSVTQFLSTRDRFLELLFRENVMDLMLVLTQHVGGSCCYLRQDNLLLLETLHYIFLGQESELTAKASQKGSKVDEDVKASLNSLESLMMEEEEKRRLARLQKFDRYSQFSGTFTRLAVDGSKTLIKGNPGAAHDNLPKPNKVHRGPSKRIAWDHRQLSSSKENVLHLIHDFINQLLSGGYNVLMQSIREDIEKEHAIQNSDIVIFFQVAQFVTAFQYHKFLTSKPSMETDASEAFINKHADSTLFQGEFCGPIAATMNEAMFNLVISKWRFAFDGLKETNDYKFLSVSGSLMKNMILMLDLTLKLLSEDSREPQTARILLYKLFYDQTDQGMTQFLMSLIKSFDPHKQPKSDLADLVEMIHVIVRLMENLHARGTIRVAKRSRKGRKKKRLGDSMATEDERLGTDDNNNVESGIDNVTHQPSSDLSITLKEQSTNLNSDGREEGIGVPDHAEQSETPQLIKSNLGDDVDGKDKEEDRHDPDDLAYGTGDSSDDDQTAATSEVDFKVSGLVATFASNIIIHNLCWLLKFYKSNSSRTNHCIVSMLRRICDDLELSPMLYQLSLLTTFYDIMAEQKSSYCKEYQNIVSFLTNLVRKMLRKMKSQPILFVEILFWKTRKECHYINSESLLHELGNLKKETRKWGFTAGETGEIGPSQSKGGIGHRNIADSLGEDEADFVMPHEPSFRKEEDSDDEKFQNLSDRNGDSVKEQQKSAASLSNHQIDSEGHSLEHESPRVSKRKRRLVFDEELDADIKKLYERYKDDQHCVQLIVEELGPHRKVSRAQVSNKLKQLGLRVTSKRRKLHALEAFPSGDDHVMPEGRVMDNDTGVPKFNGLEETSFPSNSRKRMRAFSNEQEEEVKNLYEKFKDHKRCTRMIADALDSGNRFTAAQISRLFKQLGLLVPKQKRLAQGKKHPEGLVNDEKEKESDEETLLDLKRRSKETNEVSTLGEPEKKIKASFSQDESGDECLSTILKKTGKRLAPKMQDKKAIISSDQDRVTESGFASGASQNVKGRDAPNQSNGTAQLHADTNVAVDHAHLVSNSEAGVACTIIEKQENTVVLDNVDHMPEHLHDELVDELADSGDDGIAIVPNSVVSRRKLKMVLDLEDDE
ncbi:protein timeless homolog isoform X2 [Telopea speciosissima]|uniref:protein timeless homolog isoform X2 n=1 Tax=Telopea speciosissima TaxID=54955 RepID=UPI001CC62B86|nr:protein timeless homolog isoform X2 [Telopea speciosissima]